LPAPQGANRSSKAQRDFRTAAAVKFFSLSMKISQARDGLLAYKSQPR
jgi:hypothetical protein